MSEKNYSSHFAIQAIEGAVTVLCDIKSDVVAERDVIVNFLEKKKRIISISFYLLLHLLQVHSAFVNYHRSAYF